MQFLIQKNTCLGRLLELFIQRDCIPLSDIVKKLPRSTFYELTEKRLAELNQLVKEKTGHEVISRTHSKRDCRIVCVKNPYVEIRNGGGMIEVELRK